MSESSDSSKGEIDEKTKKKLSTKKKLYGYLKERCRYLILFIISNLGHCNLPLYKKCHVDFLHDILDDRKFALETHQLRIFHIEAHWPEYAIKNVFPQIQTH